MGRVNLADLMSSDPKVKYGCAKRALALAREEPGELAPHRDFFVGLMDSENRILRWTAIDVTGALAAYDRAWVIDDLVAKITGLLDAGNMITANHAIGALAEIARARPEHRAAINRELLKVERYSYETGECRNIALGKVVLALGRYYAGLEDKAAALDFVRRQTGNTRGATRKKAERFLRTYG